MLAGLIDSDGSYQAGCFEFSQSIKHEALIHDVIFLCRSLGFACYKGIKKTCWTHKGIKYYSNAYRITISGEGIEKIPCTCPRKKANSRRQIKDVLVSGVTVRELDEDEYYGIKLDGNNTFIMSNFIA